MSKVLIIRMSALGDVAMLVPVVASVAAKYPQDRFTVMTRAAFAPLFRDLSFNVNVMPIDFRGKHKGIVGLFRIIGKAFAYSRIVDEHDVLRSKIIRSVMFLCGKKVVHIDKGRAEKKEIIETKSIDPPLKSNFSRYLDTFSRAGFPAELTFTNFFTFVPREYSELSGVITKEKKGDWIGIAPFSKHREKIYPEIKMENVVRTLANRPSTTILLFGSGKEEKAILDKWASISSNIINITGRMKLRKEILLMSYLDVMVSMDSANMHLASLVEVPVVSIWGATHPAIGFYGYRQDPDNIVQIDVACRPCSVYGDKPCDNVVQYACLNIPESVVVDKVEKVIAKSKI